MSNHYLQVQCNELKVFLMIKAKHTTHSVFRMAKRVEHAQTHRICIRIGYMELRI